jgi:subtilisin-like proprotein convertase family protein/subtilisin family serine protease
MAEATRSKAARSKAAQSYTYRGGKKLALKKRPDQFVVRRLPSELPVLGEALQVSSASARVSCEPDQLEALMGQARETAVAHHAYETTDTGQEFLITDRLIVTFKEPKTAEAVGTFAGKYALEIVARYSESKYLFRLTNATGTNPVKLVVKLTEEDTEVARVEHDLNMRFRKALDLPADPNYLGQWHLHQRLEHADFDPRSSARCEGAWQLLDGFGSADVVVGVTDDGCKLDHPDFDSPGKFAGWAYFDGERIYRRGDPGADPARMYQSGANHGTACAGVIAAEVDAEMTVGAAPGCRLLPVKWESSGPDLFISDSKLWTALNYVGDRVDVLSSSWSSVPSSRWSLDVQERIAELALTGGRRGKGILFIWAAGNDNCPISHESEQPVPYTNGWYDLGGNPRWIGVATATTFENYLVGISGVMHVAALASTARRSHYSNYGPGIEICAPTSNGHAYYRMFLDGLDITTTTGAWGGVRYNFSGTSSSAPLVAGIAALVICANPQLSALEVAAILRRSASKDLDLTGYPRTPPSQEDPNPTWDISPIAPFDKGNFIDIGSADGSWSPWFGYGKVDAQEAVRAALATAGERTTRVRVEMAPNLPIPDRDHTGIVSRVSVPDSGQVRGLKVHVDIEHTYIGDLIVRLSRPDGRRADLHYREGGSAHDLVKTFDAARHAQLAMLLGEDIQGNWTLEISDEARYDEGRLRRWSLEADVLSEGTQRFESAPGRTIPDNDPAGIEDRINVTGIGSLHNIAVEVDITHTWIGDLQVSLRSPSETEVILHAQEGRSADDIQHTYTVSDEPALGNLIGQIADGDWVLKVSDRAGLDVGKLNRWALKLS